MDWRRGSGWLVGTALVAVELAFGLNYPLFRDELYYLACADHLAWGSVDQPPLSIAALWAWKGVFGDSQLSVRVLPAALGLARVVLTTRLARRLGGGPAAEWTAALVSAFAPGMLGANGYFSMNAFDLVFWAWALGLVAALADGAPPRTWLWLGGVAGLGGLNKWSLLFFLAGLGVGVLATPLRRHLARWELWAGLGLAAALQAPHLVWQARHGWPTLEFIANATRLKNVALGPLDFLAGQALEAGPAAVPFWLAGLGSLLFAKGGRFRVLAFTWLVPLAIFVAQHGKPYYLLAAYPPLFAASGVLVEQLARRWRRPAFALVATATAGQLALAPFAIPVLPPASFVAYARALGVAPVAQERSALGPLPQFFADRFGWEELARTVALAYRALPPEAQAAAVIVADNYGEAAAVDYYGRGLGLPRASSQHNSYYLWGPPPGRLDVVIVIGEAAEDLAHVFRACTPVGRIESPWAMPYEKARPVQVCRGLLGAPDAVWRQGRHFI